MKEIFKNIFARIWALWGIITFIITFIIIYIPSMLTYLIPGKKGQTIFIAISRIWMNVWLTLIGCPVKVLGKENIQKGETYIFTCNHNTLLDVPLSSPFIPDANKTIAKMSFAKIPLFGWYYAKGSILVDRKSDASRRKGFELMKRTLEEKIHVCIYPEGTRNRTGNPLKSFYDGAFKLSVDSSKAIIPSIIYNTKKAMPNDKTFYLLPCKLAIHFLPPIYPENLTTKALKEKVFNVMYEKVKQV
ncbi:MAG: 1-acyl-sn-glycerol-3-phosphate acyltransferase [Chitinophagaceae bacterium]|nr:1-acyl-sn-glycerol-3-phosphate acyltransferase [Chitinophagaceae bacterium]MCW5905056.1 1-acyl-sn-glycerol-3-phosphate acyltransferase [Chitinophagaceae bacterium]